MAGMARAVVTASTTSHKGKNITPDSSSICFLSIYLSLFITIPYFIVLSVTCRLQSIKEKLPYQISACFFDPSNTDSGYKQRYFPGLYGISTEKSQEKRQKNVNEDEAFDVPSAKRNRPENKDSFQTGVFDL